MFRGESVCVRLISACVCKRTTVDSVGLVNHRRHSVQNETFEKYNKKKRGRAPAPASPFRGTSKRSRRTRSSVFVPPCQCWFTVVCVCLFLCRRSATESTESSLVFTFLAALADPPPPRPPCPGGSSSVDFFIFARRSSSDRSAPAWCSSCRAPAPAAAGRARS